MAVMEFELPDIWTLAGLVLALIGIGAAMTSVPGPGHWEFRISRICFVGAALLFFAKLAIWGAQDLTPVRIGMVAAAGAIIAISLSYTINWVNKKEAVTSQQPLLPDVTKQSDAADSSPLDNIVQISCDHSIFPSTVPQNKMFELQLNNQYIMAGGVFSAWSWPTGAPITRDPDMQPISGWRVRFSNYRKNCNYNPACAG
jgi:hypothetical protein